MKTNIKSIFVIALTALMAVSCTDLDVDVKSKYTSYPTSEVAIEAKMADVYYSFRGLLGRRFNECMELSSEFVGISFDGDWLDNYNYAHMSLHNFSPDDPAIGQWWDLSSGITKCNQVIVDLGGDEADPASIATARAMRAFYHFVLMDSYGDIPILDKIPGADEAIERQPRKDVAEFIESELIDILPYLSEENNETTYGKPNKWMAEALLVKLYINWAVYTCGDVTQYSQSVTNSKLNDCVKYCDDIINSGIFNLGGTYSYREKFFNDNGVHIKDFIYAMPYDRITQTGMNYGRFRTWRKADGGGADGKTTYYGEAKSNSWGGNFAIAPETADLFTLEGDDRNDVILKGTIPLYDPATKSPKVPAEDWTYKGSTVTLSKTITLKAQTAELNVGNDVNGWSQGYKSLKFYPVDADYSNGRNQSNDVPIFRYADILLTKAEAILRGATATSGDTPVSLFNQIRSYSHAPTVSSVNLTDIYEERGREFFDENWRRNDMIRFDMWESEFGYHKKGFPTARFDKEVRLFPIPTKILELNTNWTQNAGY